MIESDFVALVEVSDRQALKAGLAALRLEVQGLERELKRLEWRRHALVERLAVLQEAELRKQ